MDSVEYTKCYVAYLDILGMKEFVRRSEQDPELRDRLRKALMAARSIPPYLTAQYKAETRKPVKNVLRLQVLSDSVILFIPEETFSIAWFLKSVRKLYDELICLGFCIRGGLALGSMLWEPQTVGSHADNLDEAARDSIALGPALESAYVIESEIAVYPRIVLSEALCTHINTLHLDRQRSSRSDVDCAFPLATHDYAGGVRTFIKPDFDGCPFLDILHKGIDRGDKISGNGTQDDRNRFSCTPRDVWLQTYRDVAIAGLGNWKDEKIRAKYSWLLNYVCSSCEGGLGLSRHKCETTPEN